MSEATGDEWTNQPTGNMFFLVSNTKLIVMGVLTFGLYTLYWMYQHWAHVKRYTREEMIPFGRAIFFNIWIFSLANRVEAQVRESGRTSEFSLVGAAVVCFILNIVTRYLPDPYFWIWVLMPFSLWPIQAEANRSAKDISGDVVVQTKFSGWDIAGCLIGGILLIFAIFGTAYPPEDMRSDAIDGMMNDIIQSRQ